jgi:hypothetical protein
MVLALKPGVNLVRPSFPTNAGAFASVQSQRNDIETGCVKLPGNLEITVFT